MSAISNFRNLLLLLVILITQVFVKTAFANSYVASSNIIKEIEKTLLFDKESRKKINVYKKDLSVRESDYNMTAGDSNDDISGGNNDINIVITDSETENFDIRAKEKLAYNAVLIDQYEVAVALYKQVIASEPNNHYSKFSLAVVYQRMGQLAQAKALYRDLLQDDPKNKEEIIGNLLSILIEESPKDALYLLSRLTIQSPKSAYILAQAAIVYDKMKNYPNAVSLLNRAIALDPTNIGYKYNLAIIYDKLTQSDKALELYKEVLRDFSNENQLVSIDQVQRRIHTIQNSL